MSTDIEQIEDPDTDTDKNRKGLKIAVTLFMIILVIGIVLLVSGYLKKKFRAMFRVGGNG